MRRLVIVATLALFGSLLLVSPAHAVETQAVRGPEVFAQFNNGHVGWFKVAVEKDLANGKLRVKLTVWCEPNTTVGGDKVACDAIDMTNGAGRVVSAQFWHSTQGWTDLVGINADVAAIDYSPPTVGIAATSGWYCAGGTNDVRGFGKRFRAAAGNQWSQYYDRVTPTDHDLGSC